MMHNWSPLVIPVDSSGADLVLADTTQFLTAVSIDSSGSPATVTAQTGVTMDVLLQDLENAGLGLTAHPAPGDITLGGALAIDGHGTAVPAEGETIIPGHTYGSVSNLILSLTAVVWSASQGQYVLQTFERSDPAIQPLLTHLGRTFVTEVTLQVGANTRLRCQSFVDVPASAAIWSAGFELADLRFVRGAVRPGGDDLVPLHVRALAEGMDDRTSETSVVTRGQRTLQLCVCRRHP